MVLNRFPDQVNGVEVIRALTRLAQSARSRIVVANDQVDLSRVRLGAPRLGAPISL